MSDKLKPCKNCQKISNRIELMKRLANAISDMQDVLMEDLEAIEEAWNNREAE